MYYQISIFEIHLNKLLLKDGSKEFDSNSLMVVCEI